MDDVPFGLAIRVARDQAGLKQYELADKAEMIRTNLTRLERGNPKNPGMPTRIKLASALGLTVDQVMEIGRAYVASHPSPRSDHQTMAETVPAQVAQQAPNVRMVSRRGVMVAGV